MTQYDWNDFGLKIPEIMIPREGTDYFRWAVVACDQYTSEPEYWDKVNEIVGDTPSALNMMLPEIYLGKDGEEDRIANIKATMRKYLEDGTLQTLKPGCMLVRRTAEGRTRMGLVIATDLEAYDYSVGSSSLTRATEGTVVERIPPRLRIREGAPLEMPHIIILIDDPEHTVIEPLAEQPRTLVYDTDLMMDGGHITGSFIEECYLGGACEALSALYEAALEKYGDGKVIFQAMGDGNHSLATAKAAWEQLKPTLTLEEQKTHPARYALCEIENIHDEGIVFEPIHRVLFSNRHGESGMKLVEILTQHLNQQNKDAYIILDEDYTVDGLSEAAESPRNPSDLYSRDKNIPEGAFVIPFITMLRRGRIVIDEPTNKLEVGALQKALDVMVKEEKLCDIDYIHGADTVEKLSVMDGNAGFLLPAMDKFMLFPAVAADGALPRKTFSMGEANEKRYYIEARRITE